MPYQAPFAGWPAVFIVCQPKLAQAPPDRNPMGFEPMLVLRLDHPFIRGQAVLFLDPASDTVSHAGGLALPTTTGLLLGLQRSCSARQKNHVIHKPDRNPELRYRNLVRVALFNKINDPMTKLPTKWACASRTPNDRNRQRQSQIRPQANPRTDRPQFAPIPAFPTSCQTS